MEQPTEFLVQAHRAWDPAVRLFHWINVAAVLILIAGGLIVMYIGRLGIPAPGALVLKHIHVWAGYVFVVNLLARLVWAWCGPRSARWAAILPFQRGFFRSLARHIRAVKAGGPCQYVGHSPSGRLAITGMLVLMMVLGGTGLVLAGSDLYYPPLGRFFAAWVAAPGVPIAEVVPYEPALVDRSAFDEVREFRKPYALLHDYGFYALAAMIVLHVVAVVAMDLRGASLTSSMVTGIKVMRVRPADADNPDSGR